MPTNAIKFLYETPKSKVTPINTKYIVTKDKSIKNNQLVGVDLKKGDIIQGISITTVGDMANDSGTESLKFTDKDNNVFSVRIGYRGFEPFFEEYTIALGGGANPNNMGNNQPNQVAQQSFIEKHKTNLLIVGAIVLGYFAYKKFKK
jgi:hypothetical protein